MRCLSRYESKQYTTCIFQNRYDISIFNLPIHFFDSLIQNSNKNFIASSVSKSKTSVLLPSTTKYSQAISNDNLSTYTSKYVLNLQLCYEEELQYYYMIQVLLTKRYSTTVQMSNLENNDEI
jgi:hypothetical protein